MAKTHAQRVTELETLLTEIETKGQVRDEQGKIWTRANYAAVLAEYRRERALADREARGGVRVMRVVPE